ncbi:MAG: quinone oxidoreductase [Alphaproteobacteria bacterium]|nr:quinone oxidoreductase [Alphaproteobacteria bacterium]
MTKAIVVRQPGGPEVLKLEDVTVPAPAAGQVRLRQTAIGVNFIDTYHRSGLYPVPKPFTPGMEAIGFVEDVGPGVTDLKSGDRVCYGNGPIGGYAEERVIPAASLVKVPAKLKDEHVAGMMLRGLTVWYLVRSLHKLQPGETVLFHAAAGGVGLIFCQWAKAIGANVIGTVGDEAKAKLAKDAGCDYTILYKSDDFVAKVKDITGGKGVSVVYDGVGKDTFFKSLDCLQKRGLMVSFGNASGPPPAIEVALLQAKGSVFLTRPSLADYTGTREALVQGSTELFDLVGKGAIEIDVGQTFSLEYAGHAQRDLEARKTTGSTILLP